MDIDTLTIEDLTGRVRVAEERFELDAEEDGTDKLLLTEEEWVARSKRREHGISSGLGGSTSFNNRR